MTTIKFVLAIIPIYLILTFLDFFQKSIDNKNDTRYNKDNQKKGDDNN